ncbi:uncharacterized protein B0I36DRAFT_387286 [Microdochium trichocladiopsis]|uniref:FluG domain-containing protein n=1 Tax=Microdochium trichocladiopsis TaxID=1682393 RepID=A0A9P8XYD5_9PEZI|nr:uncharacterized protein B0I36DRAFT_387286 [Microdochium trichocladiopsis]KAH7024844.1 hypothetical protein B0I36DRAFT_387286 [Microdochium trichocladiopsis]
MADSTGGATALAPKVGDVKRRSLWEQINKINVMDSSAIFESLEALKQAHEDARGFRWKAKKTQAEEDRIRAQYKGWLQAYHLIPKDDSDELIGLAEKDVDALMFPENTDSLQRLLRMFLAWVAEFGEGRELNKRISFKAYVKYRAALMFWTYRTRTMHNFKPELPRSTLWNNLTEIMQYSAKRFGLELSGKINVTHLGLAELRRLLDWDLINTPCIEVAEGHQPAWCIGRTCAVRPGSIGIQPGAEELDCLTFGDFEFSRGREPGHFTCTITFRILKTNREDIQGALQKPVQARTIKCVVRTPKVAGNLVFSIIHRVLVIALRRNALDGISTIQELLHGDKQHIVFKPECLNLPLVRASAPRGLGVSEKPALATSLTEYLQRRGKAVGFQERITFYSLRRRTATDVTRKVGPDTAKRLLNHDPDSVTLQLFYVDLEATTDLTALTLDEQVEDGGHSKDLVAENHPLALNALSADSLQRVHGAALNSMMSKIMQNDPPRVRNEREQKNYRRRVRQAALNALLSEESQKLGATMTKMDYQQRVDELDKSKTMDKVFELAVKALREQHAAAASTEEEEEEQPHDTIDPETGFYKMDDQDVALMVEDDLEDQVDPQSTEPVFRTLDDEVEAGDDTDFNDLATNIPYVHSVEVFMDILMNNTMSQYENMKHNPIPCPLCQEDETIDDGLKGKLYNRKDILDGHMHSITHSRLGRWKREALQKAASHPEGRVTCPLCEAVGLTRTYEKINLLVRHVRYDTVNAQHEDLKVQGGWYDNDFVREMSDLTRHKAERRQQKKRRDSITAAGHRYSSDVALSAGIPVENRPSLVRGGPHEYKQPANTFMTSVMDIPMPSVPLRQQRNLFLGPIGEAEPIEPALQSLLFFSPRTAPSGPPKSYPEAAPQEEVEPEFEHDAGAEDGGVSEDEEE